MDPKNPAPADLASPLWEFAISYWQRPGVEETCLQLQEAGWSVTQVVCAGWLSATGRVYDGAEPDELRAWRQEMTEKIRLLRKSINKQDNTLKTLRQQLAKAELEAEKTELYRAWQWLAANTRKPVATLSPGELALINFRAAAPTPDEGTRAEQQGILHLLASQLQQT